MNGKIIVQSFSNEWMKESLFSFISKNNFSLQNPEEQCIKIPVKFVIIKNLELQIKDSITDILQEGTLLTSIIQPPNQLNNNQIQNPKFSYEAPFLLCVIYQEIGKFSLKKKQPKSKEEEKQIIGEQSFLNKINKNYLNEQATEEDMKESQGENLDYRQNSYYFDRNSQQTQKNDAKFFQKHIQFSKKWKNQSLKIKFLNHIDQQMKDNVFQILEEEGQQLNLAFNVTENQNESDIRIQFKNKEGFWSLIGTDALLVDKHKATMNLPLMEKRDISENEKKQIIHQFYHAIGLEHQNFGGIKF